MTTGLAAREEPGRYYTFPSRLPRGEFFEIRPQILPHNAKPITDDESGMCIGYSVSQAPGLGEFMILMALLSDWKKPHWNRR